MRGRRVLSFLTEWKMQLLIVVKILSIIIATTSLRIVARGSSQTIKDERLSTLDYPFY